MKCIEDEIPFEIPDGWAWTRLSSILNLFITGPFGSSLHKSDYVLSGTPLINPMNIIEGKIIANPQMQVSENTVSRLSAFMVQEGDVVIARRGEIGRCAVVEKSQKGWLCGTGSFVLRVSQLVDSYYIAARIRASDSISFLSGNSLGNTMLNLNQSILNSLLIPLPPINEQKNLLIAGSKANALISQLVDSNEALTKLINIAKSKILDLAIRGQLVPQAPADEPASALLERIRAEKEELIKQSKIKRDKKESFIFKGEDNSYYEKVGNETTCIDDLLPFEIPDNWGWVRMKEVCIINPRNNVSDDTEVSFIPMPLIQEGFANSHSSESRMWAQVKTGFTHFREYDVGVAKITPCFENRKSVVFHNLKNGIGAGTTELHILRPKADAIIPEYILAILKTNSFITGGVQTFSSAVGQQRINKDYVAEYLIPLPPHGEQRRICDKVAHVLDMLSTIETSLS